jgi:hypothetical protein
MIRGTYKRNGAREDGLFKIQKGSKKTATKKTP